jgi:hypothetical protein
MPARLALGPRLAAEAGGALLTEDGQTLVPEETLLPAAILRALAPRFCVTARWEPRP